MFQPRHGRLDLREHRELAHRLLLVPALIALITGLYLALAGI